MVSYVIAGLLLIFLIYIFSIFNPSPTKEITDGLYAVRSGFSNFYALKHSGGVILFDAGMNPPFASAGLKKLGIDSKSVTHIFLTHSDYDHTGGISAFSGARTVIPAEEEQMINGNKARRAFMHNKKISSYETMNDGEIMNINGVEIKLMHSPGHTPGSAAYLINGRFLATGDLLRVTRRGDILPFLRMMNMDQKLDAKSVEKIKNVIENVEFILTGHSGVKAMKYGK